MSVIGPRPLLVEYLPYYTKEEHHRHDVRPGFPYWNDIREFVKKTGTPIERICCDLDFSVFDE